MANGLRVHRAPADEAASTLAELPERSHIVQFYESDSYLFETVARFLGAGLVAGDRLVVIATPAHCDGLLRQLRTLDCDPEKALAEGQLNLLDVEETLSKFMVNGAPDGDRFRGLLDGVIERATAGIKGTRLRLYGEMVDALWRAGNRSAAIQLEQFWNEAAQRHSFSLLCAYVMSNFYKRVDSQAPDPEFMAVCSFHSHVIPAESPEKADSVSPDSRSGDRIRELEAEIEERKRVEQALRDALRERGADSDSRFRLLVETVRDYAIFMLDPGGYVSTWNSGAERLKGYTREEIVGKHFSQFYPSEDVAAGKCDRELEDAIRYGRFEDEGWRIRKDGSRFWANVVITTLRDWNGMVVGFAKVTRDLTDRVRAEHERAQALAMQEAVRQRDDFLAIMGHELRNPLASVVTAVHLIRLRGGRASEKEMGVLERQSRQMTRLLDDLLDASRALRNKVSFIPKTIELGQVLANAIELAHPLVEQRSHDLIVDVPDRGLLVEVDPERMAQVFGNILNNAAKYTPEGGKIRLSATATERQVSVSVEDTGQGIARDMLGRVFDLFVQGEGGAERSGGGLGIGLAVAQKLVHAHQGEILVESNGPGRGSRFTVRLPAAKKLSEPFSPDGPHSGPQMSRRRILLVDDNRDSVELMRTLLDCLGHQTHTAFDGPGAVQACREFRPEMVLLDIGLPGMTGYEVASQMRALPGCEQIPIIAISGYAREADRAQALQAGFSDHLAKPIEIERLEELVQTRPATENPPQQCPNAHGSGYPTKPVKDFATRGL
jgi:PAS domain S-box-containing protein